ncbi:hypothetical protein RFI_15252, partial [Reticulomyxa filosa]
SDERSSSEKLIEISKKYGKQALRWTASKLENLNERINNEEGQGQQQQTTNEIERQEELPGSENQNNSDSTIGSTALQWSKSAGKTALDWSANKMQGLNNKYNQSDTAAENEPEGGGQQAGEKQ